MHPAMIHGYADVLVRLGMQKEADELLKRAAGPLGSVAPPSPQAAKPMPGPSAPKGPASPAGPTAAGLPQRPNRPIPPKPIDRKSQAAAYAQNIPAPPSIPGM